MENPSDYFDSWLNGYLKAQQQALAAMQNQALQMQSLYQNSTVTSDNPFTAWSKAVFQAFPTGMGADLAKETFSKALYGNAAMQKIYELWQPLLNAMRDKSIDSASYSDLTDPAKIKQLVDKLFNFDLDAMSQLQKQLSQYIDLYQQFSKPYTDSAKNQFGNFTQSDFQPEALVKQMQSAYTMFENSTGKLFSVPAVGKDREKIELFSQCAKAFSDFAASSIEYQKLMQTTGSEAMQAVIKTLAAKVQAGEKFEKFDEFFALWIDTNEQTFNKLFQTKAYSQKRNAMTEAGFKARKLYHQVLESQLADFPIARRSEMDEVYKTIYDLRKEVKSLKSEIEALKNNSAKDKE